MFVYTLGKVNKWNMYTELNLIYLSQKAPRAENIRVYLERLIRVLGVDFWQLEARGPGTFNWNIYVAQDSKCLYIVTVTVIKQITQ